MNNKGSGLCHVCAISDFTLEAIEIRIVLHYCSVVHTQILNIITKYFETQFIIIFTVIILIHVNIICFFCVFQINN